MSRELRADVASTTALTWWRFNRSLNCIAMPPPTDVPSALALKPVAAAPPTNSRFSVAS
jgi:hypothetical protein